MSNHIRRMKPFSGYGPAYMVDDKKGQYVTYADHVAAVAEANAYALNRLLEAGEVGLNEAYEQGQRDAIAKAVQRVEALWRGPDGVWLTKSEVIAAIDGLRGESNG